MKRTTKVIAIFTAILLILSAIPITAYAASWNISVKVNNKAISFPDQKPIIQNERTLVPIRFVAEALGYDVDWNEQDNTAVIDNGKIILLNLLPALILILLSLLGAYCYNLWFI